MATGFPAQTGDVLSAPMFNELVQYTINPQSGTSYTLVAADQYQVLVVTSNAGTKDVLIPTDANVDFAIGTAITVLNTGAGDATIKAVTSGTTTVTSAGGTSAQPKLVVNRAAVAIKTAANTWSVVGSVS
jgi:hypothetical protein